MNKIFKNKFALMTISILITLGLAFGSHTILKNGKAEKKLESQDLVVEEKLDFEAENEETLTVEQEELKEAKISLDKKTASNKMELTETKPEDLSKAQEPQKQAETKPSSEKPKPVEQKISYREDAVETVIDFQTETINDGNTPKNDGVVTREGVKGIRRITTSIKFVNGIEESRTITNDVVITNPINEIITVGTKVATPNVSGNSINDMVNHINASRSQNGLSALVISSELNRAADIRAKEIEVLFSHTRPDGTQWHTVSNKANGENISYGYSSASNAHNGFMNSPGHKANILRVDWKNVGVGYHKGANGTVYWVVLFGL